MHPRIIFLAAINIVFDLLCIAAAGVVLLTQNLWLQEVGEARFWLIATLCGFTLVPVMYAFERQAVAHRIGANPEKIGATLPAWSGVDRTVRA
jgi:hypothetical protein